MNLRWRDPAAVMHRDLIIFYSNSTITARFEVKILNNYIKGEMSVYSSKSLQLKVTSLVSNYFPYYNQILCKRNVLCG